MIEVAFYDTNPYDRRYFENVREAIMLPLSGLEGRMRKVRLRKKSVL